MADSPECPPLTGTSVDFDALQAAAKAGEDLTAFLAAKDAPVAETEPAPAKRGKAETPSE